MFSVYVSGTDTGIGKTLASCTLLHALRGHGLRVAGMKPVASGCARIDGEWKNEDALALQHAGESGIAYADINPFALEHPLAPELAARDAGIEVALPPILAAHARLAEHADALIVEGVGGWAAPLSASLMQADLVRALRVPVLLVVGLRLGCLNHALLSAQAIAADGAHLAGWIASHVDPDMDRVDDNIGMLRARMPAPCWGVLPHVPDADPAQLASQLRIPMLAE
ncbi:dethiobiotin synthase [Thermomonas carbonis]|uniref:ATP-dependent dethiobiotin synthetase BioD n=1 Tax=Thermomonas carbonis TaxID=1463158 RepID=A0A7G9SRZ8_9GAMM|nr:dethiobiotin synthase [Thermomonas carbonis]QNN70623.1 dethiobiotin synthase [Thermomonas carbonis]GHC01236.1 ATP-dependent dethiobiotin synthetase BioD [Thermomonas carbonis]